MLVIVVCPHGRSAYCDGDLETVKGDEEEAYLCEDGSLGHGLGLSNISVRKECGEFSV